MSRDFKLSERAGRLLRASGKTMAVAESCTGGMLGAVITSVPGSSDYFLGGIIAYHDRIKERQLGVSRGLLKKFGAVSAETSFALARGARKNLRADIGIGITGIAGPSGGTRKKPVGLVFISAASGRKQQGLKLRLQGNRDAVRRGACRKALELLIKFLERK